MIDISSMSMEELEELSDCIYERLKLLDNMRAHQSMMVHNLGDRVCFNSPQRGYQVGQLVKFNRKTVVVITEDGKRWKVSPHILSPFKDIDETD